MALLVLATLLALSLCTVITVVVAASLPSARVPAPMPPVVTTLDADAPAADFDAIVATLLGSDPSFAERVARAVDDRA